MSSFAAGATGKETCNFVSDISRLNISSTEDPAITPSGVFLQTAHE
jgi:hypothetical protein